MPASDFKIAPQQITGFTFVNGLKEEARDPQRTNYTFHFDSSEEFMGKLRLR